MQEEQEKQPLLPRVGMIWFFIVATLVAVGIGLVRSAEHGKALSVAIASTGGFLLLFFFLSGICFWIAFMFGATERKLFDHETPESPFVSDLPPEQIIPPLPRDST